MQFQAIFRQFPALNFFKHCQIKVNFTWKDKHFNFARASERLKNNYFHGQSCAQYIPIFS